MVVTSPPGLSQACTQQVLRGCLLNGRVPCPPAFLLTCGLGDMLNQRGQLRSWNRNPSPPFQTRELSPGPTHAGLLGRVARRPVPWGLLHCPRPCCRHTERRPLEISAEWSPSPFFVWTLANLQCRLFSIFTPVISLTMIELPTSDKHSVF